MNSSNAIPPLHPLLARLRPDLAARPEVERFTGILDVLTVLYTLPLAVVGLIWLAFVTDWGALLAQWPILLTLLGLMFLFSNLSYVLVVGIHKTGYAQATGEFDGAFLWTALLLVGPSALWLSVIHTLIGGLRRLRPPYTPERIWLEARSQSTDYAVITLAFLITWQMLFPNGLLTDFRLPGTLRILAAMGLQFVFQVLVWAGYMIGSLLAVRTYFQSPLRPMLRFLLLAMGLPALATPFAILLAGLYTGVGVWAFLMATSGMLLVALLARKLGRAAEESRQQAAQMQQLERLGRAMLSAPPDASALPGLLKEYVPVMFTFGKEVVWLAPDQILFQSEQWTTALPETSWGWLQTQTDGSAFLAKQAFPWGGAVPAEQALLIAPIRDTATNQPLGGVWVELTGRFVHWDAANTASLLHGVHTLAAQVASALHQAQIYAETLAHQRTQQELALARRIQDSFLPEELPTLPGWQLAAALEPARQVAGDFYDVIPLPGGKIGLLIADVADKGLGPSLYMALSCTLIRTHAVQFPDCPRQVLAATNQRVIADARASLFVTAFYAVLDPQTGVLTWSNAGHNPPYLFHADGSQPQLLGNPGYPLGVEEDARLKEFSVPIEPGDRLIFYTDGLSDAQNERQEFLGLDLLNRIGGQRGLAANQILAAIQGEVRQFIGSAPQFDDITLIVLVRE